MISLQDYLKKYTTISNQFIDDFLAYMIVKHKKLIIF